MAGVPLVSLLSTAGVLAYLNAKLAVGYDCSIILPLIRALRFANQAESIDRANAFYNLEQHALYPKTETRIFLYFEGQTWTYHQAYEIILKYGQWLKHEHNVAAGDIVAMAMTNKPEFIWIWFGLWSLGAKPAFINHNLRGDALVHCVRLSTGRLLIVDEEIEEAITAVVRAGLTPSDDVTAGQRAVHICVLDSSCEERIDATATAKEPDSVRSGQKLTDLACLIYTSGTTGLPKAAIVSWWKFQVGMATVSGFLNLTPEDRLFTCMPLYHSAASVLCLAPCLRNANTFILGRKFSASQFWEQATNSEATVIQYVGETLRYLVSTSASKFDKTHKVRAAYGNGLRPDVWGRFKQRFGVGTILELYGATEGVGGFQNLTHNDYAIGAVGRSGLLSRTLFGRSWALVEIDHDKQEPFRQPRSGFCVKTRINVPGELIQRLPENEYTSFQGYWGNETASEKKVLRNDFRQGDLWYRTGDLLHMDKEGRIYFSDRVGDTFRWKSENVSTSEVAEACSQHPDVEEVTVYGVAIPHHDGRAGCAAIVLREGSQATPAFMKSFAEHVTKSLPTYARPLFLRFTARLEKTGTNKQVKTVLREQGVDPEKLAGSDDHLVWMNNGTFRPFGEREWSRLAGESVKL